MLQCPTSRDSCFCGRTAPHVNYIDGNDEGDGRAQSHHTQPRPSSPGVDLQLAGGHVAAGELVHAVVPPVVGGEDAEQQRTRLRAGGGGVRHTARTPRKASRRQSRHASPPLPGPRERRQYGRGGPAQPRHLLPVDRLLRFLLDLLLRDARLHRHLVPQPTARMSRGARTILAIVERRRPCAPGRWARLGARERREGGRGGGRCVAAAGRLASADVPAECRHR